MVEMLYFQGETAGKKFKKSLFKPAEISGRALFKILKSGKT
jgi:hypothetical protein